MPQRLASSSQPRLAAPPPAAPSQPSPDQPSIYSQWHQPRWQHQCRRKQRPWLCVVHSERPSQGWKSGLPAQLRASACASSTFSLFAAGAPQPDTAAPTPLMAAAPPPLAAHPAPAPPPPPPSHSRLRAHTAQRGREQRSPRRRGATPWVSPAPPRATHSGWPAPARLRPPPAREWAGRARTPPGDASQRESEVVLLRRGGGRETSMSRLALRSQQERPGGVSPTRIAFLREQPALFGAPQNIPHPRRNSLANRLRKR